MVAGKALDLQRLIEALAPTYRVLPVAKMSTSSSIARLRAHTLLGNFLDRMLNELDRFIHAMIAIREEIRKAERRE